MAVLLLNSCALQVSIRYIWQKRLGSPYYYRRRVPKDVTEIHARSGKPVSGWHIQALRTRDLQLAAKWIAQINRKLEELWHQLRQSQAVTALGETARETADKLLAGIGLESVAMDHKRQSTEAAGQILEQLSRDGTELSAAAPLPDFEQRALQVVSGKYEHRLSDAMEHYLSTREECRKRRNNTDRAFALVSDVLGDRPLTQYKRKDVAEVIKQSLASGLKTASVRKRLGCVRCAVKELIRDQELEGVKNAFTEFKIPNNGEDAEKRSSLSAEQLKRLRDFTRKDDHKDNTSADILGLLIDTGARLSEVVGLRREDVVLDAEVPHIHIRPNPLRRLKTKSSTRVVPLVGDALFAAQRAMQTTTDSPHFFPKYMPETGINNESASATLRKIMKHRNCLTPHSLRHTMRTRLRNANIPQPRVDELQGWTDGTMANYYGEGTALRLLRADLIKTLAGKLD